MQTKTITVKRTCVLCGKPSEVTVPKVDYVAWQRGMFVQDAFPYLSADERETLISGSHGACFDEYFKDEDHDISTAADNSEDAYEISMADIQDYDLD